MIIPTTPPIGRLWNNWRKRDVIVYDHPTEKDMVVTVGFPYNGGEPVVCNELRANWRRVIEMFPEVAEYD